MSFLAIPEKHSVLIRNLNPLARLVNRLLDGKSNNTGTVTLTPSSSTTTVLDKRVGSESVILLTPMTNNASAAGNIPYISARTAGESFELTHASNGQTDKTFDYIIVG